ncbi:MAG: hypothetical protein ACREDC_10895 [Bradyrhizobium sp.]
MPKAEQHGCHTGARDDAPSLRESGKQHVEEYLNVKAVWIKTA